MNRSVRQEPRDLSGFQLILFFTKIMLNKLKEVRILMFRRGEVIITSGKIPPFFCQELSRTSLDNENIKVKTRTI